MKKSLTALALLAGLGLMAGDAKAQTAHTETLTWTWPTVRADGVTPLPLSSIGSIAIFDSGSTPPTPGALGTPVTCNAGAFPPTAATGSCTTGGLIAGTHTFTAVVSDNASPPDVGTPSMTVSVSVPLAGPGPVTNFAGTLN